MTITLLKLAMEALANVPFVMGTYDQQHSNTHTKAYLQIKEFVDNQKQPRFPLNLKFNYRNRERTILNIYTTRDEAGNAVKINYLVAHDFLGQLLTEEMIDTTIARSLTNEQLRLYL